MRTRLAAIGLLAVLLAVSASALAANQATGMTGATGSAGAANSNANTGNAGTTNVFVMRGGGLGGFGGFGLSPLGFGSGLDLGGGCLGDLRNVRQSTGVRTSTHQRVGISPQDALLGIDYALTTGPVSFGDLYDTSRTIRASENFNQRTRLGQDEVVSGIALGGGICGFGGVFGGGGALIGGDIHHRNSLVARERNSVDLNANTILSAIALSNAGALGAPDLSSLANRDTSSSVRQSVNHNIDLNNRETLFDIALLG